MTLFNNPFFVRSDDMGLYSGKFGFYSEQDRLDVLRLADEVMQTEIPPLYATTYLNFARTGDRRSYDRPMGTRRHNVEKLLLGIMAGEKEKYTDRLIDYIWAICEETSWVIPAHNISLPYVLHKNPLPDAFACDPPEVELFGADTASIFAFVILFAGDLLDAVTPVIRERMLYEIDRRVFRPFLDHEMRWSTKYVNNWTPWIVSSVLNAAIICEKDEYRFFSICSRCMTYLDRLVASFTDDGACSEGPSYWNAAVGAVFDSAESLYEISDGKVDVFSAPMFKRMCEYYADLCVSPENNLFVNFADGPTRLFHDRRFLARMGRRVGSEKLISLAASLGSEPQPAVERFFLVRTLRSLSEPLPVQVPFDYRRETNVYGDLQVCTMRRGKFFLGIKGGTNGEQHNHNDIGSLALYFDGDAILCDPGVGAYRRETFNSQRYTIWTMQSSYHNLPEINGQMQLPGREYRADLFAVENDSVTVSYPHAYTAGTCEKALRTVTLTENGAEISDEVDAHAVFCFMTKTEPVCIGDRTYSVGGCTVTFSGGDVVSEKIDIADDASLFRSWKTPALYRIRVATDGRLTTIVRVKMD